MTNQNLCNTDKAEFKEKKRLACIYEKKERVKINILTFYLNKEEYEKQKRKTKDENRNE